MGLFHKATVPTQLTDTCKNEEKNDSLSASGVINALRTNFQVWQKKNFKLNVDFLLFNFVILGWSVGLSVSISRSDDEGKRYTAHR